jgi:hypothetical protein
VLESGLEGKPCKFGFHSRPLFYYPPGPGV